MKKLQLRSSQWIVNEDNGIIIGEGRMAILENVERMGSINQAAKLMKMSYKAMWSKIKATEEHLNVKVVNADRKLGTHLTKEGKALLEQYRELKRECTLADDRIFNTIFQ